MLRMLCQKMLEGYVEGNTVPNIFQLRYFFERKTKIAYELQKSPFLFSKGGRVKLSEHSQ